MIPTEAITKDVGQGYHRYMLDENKKKDKEYYESGLHVSSIGFCKRKTIFEYFDFEKRELSLSTLTTFARGNDVHDEVGRMFRHSALFEVVLAEHDISEGLPTFVKGRFDLLVNHLPTNTKILLDIKSANPKQFLGYKRGKIQLPKAEHMNQVTLYAEACDNLQIPYDILSVLYLDKGGTNDFLMFFFGKTLEAVFNMEQDIELIQQYEKDKVLPKFDLSKKDEWKCSYCPYYDITCQGKDEK